MVLWTPSSSFRLGEIDWTLPIGRLRKLIGDGHYHGRLSLDAARVCVSGNIALDDRPESPAIEAEHNHCSCKRR
jgi:hypothetical protein